MGTSYPRRSFTYGNGIAQNFYHTGRGWLYKGYGNNIFNYNMTFTGDGNIVHKDVGLNSGAINEHWDYSFDEFNRIAGANQTNAGAPPRTMTFNYDQYGNRWQQNSPGGVSKILTFSSHNNRADQFSYDALGNVLNDGAHSYTYDAENRMTQVDSGATAKYTYDAFSRRVRVDAADSAVSSSYMCEF